MCYLVLVADPDPPSARLSSLVLRAAGLSVRTAATAGEAERALVAQRPDALIVDLDLPPEGGLELVRALAADPALRVPIIAVSTRHDLTTERAARAAGCASYIAKPIDVRTFAARICALIQGTTGGAPGAPGAPGVPRALRS